LRQLGLGKMPVARSLVHEERDEGEEEGWCHAPRMALDGWGVKGVHCVTMSKPRMRAADRRSEKLQVRFTPAEMRRVQKYAQTRGTLYIGEALREIVLKAVDTCTPDC
jgi:hypothetical protein